MVSTETAFEKTAGRMVVEVRMLPALEIAVGAMLTTSTTCATPALGTRLASDTSCGSTVMTSVWLAVTVRVVGTTISGIDVPNKNVRMLERKLPDMLDVMVLGIVVTVSSDGAISPGESVEVLRIVVTMVCVAAWYEIAEGPVA